MNTPLSWIKAYVPDLACTDQEYNDKMTLSGTKVERFIRLDKNLEKIVVGKILTIDRHPDADKLVVCRVQVLGDAKTQFVPAEEITGLAEDGTVQIVTGASNLTVGDVAPVVLAGGRVAGGHDGGPLPAEGIEIRAGKLRGVESNGMLCSIEELGSSRDMYPEAPEEGIYVFPKENEPAIGSDAVAALGLRDSVFEYEITSNRVDCYSVLGVAREAAATFGCDFVPPQVEVKEGPEKVSDYVSVEVKDPDLCTRYCARVCTDVRIAESPEWMKRRLAAAGIRPINNLVDITNYVMLEYGQPMHAFDLDTVAGHKIIVRRAQDGDEFQTLDEQVRKLDKDVLMICDAEKEIGIAGIMGGENSKITDQVKTVLFEAATFNGPNIRKSAKRIGLRTDASSFFEKGLDPANAEAAINRACQLMQELSCGTVTQGMIDVKEPLKEAVRIPFTPEEINAFLGTDYSKETMLDVFRKLELVYDEAANEIVVPSFRQDLKAMCDLAEEVARFTGYDNIPMTLPKSSATMGAVTPRMKVEEKARQTALHYGFSEAMTYSFESPKTPDRLLIPEDARERQTIRIMNPLGEEFSMMRTLPVNGMLTSLATNYNHRNKDVRLFEIASVYLPKSLPLTELPDERRQLALGMYGAGDFFTMKAAVEAFLKSCGITKDVEFEADAGKSFLHPGRQAKILVSGAQIGYMGEVHPIVLKNYEIGERAYLADIDVDSVVPLSDFEPYYTGIARFPAMSRDIALLVPNTVTAGQIEKTIRENAGEQLESCRLFDIYEGKQIGIGFKSLAYNLTFRNRERTLEEAEVNAAMDKVLSALKELGLTLRG
ncbi:MAG: phenylalanine--tRNA ligase subunit beta [Lachnospiraceae bacterium]|nr:phenylalanine--tRNA ligase subunit beta [Lachnospiraceae bacterium]